MHICLKVLSISNAYRVYVVEYVSKARSILYFTFTEYIALCVVS